MAVGGTSNFAEIPWLFLSFPLVYVTWTIGPHWFKDHPWAGIIGMLCLMTANSYLWGYLAGRVHCCLFEGNETPLPPSSGA
jgi:hypothetical protein